MTKKIEEKERTLRLEKEKALSSTLASSDKLKSRISIQDFLLNMLLDLKKTAANLKQTLETLEDEILFIDDQMVRKDFFISACLSIYK